VPVPVYSELMKCTSCGREQNVGVAAVNDLRRLNRKFLCVLCGSEEQKSRAQATIVKPQITMGKEVIFDGRGYAHPETAFNPLRYVWDKDR